MLIKNNDKERFYTYVADLILNFIRISQKTGFLEYLTRCSKNPSSISYLLVRDAMIKEFVHTLDNKEMEFIFKEVENSLKLPLSDH